MDDTGATTMLLFHEDLVEIQQACGDLANYLGDITSRTANGPMACSNYRLEVNVIDEDYEEILDQWVPLTVTVKPGSRQSNGADRLSGMWLRHLLYTATCPDGKGRLYISKSRNGLVTELPSVKPDEIDPAPRFV